MPALVVAAVVAIILIIQMIVEFVESLNKKPGTGAAPASPSVTKADTQSANYTKCDTCHGTGTVAKGYIRLSDRCTNCDGYGGGETIWGEKWTCSNCDGTGKLDRSDWETEYKDEICRECNGSGWV